MSCWNIPQVLTLTNVPANRDMRNGMRKGARIMVAALMSVAKGTSPLSKPPQTFEGNGKAHGRYHDYDQWSVNLANMDTGAGGEKPDYHGDYPGSQDYIGILLPDKLCV